MTSTACQRDRLRGFTLIELTVVLAVIVTLALILTPSIANFINDSRIARARSDCKTIAGAIVQFYNDNGFFPGWPAALNGGPGLPATKFDVLVSPGNVPAMVEAGSLLQSLSVQAGAPVGWTTGRAGNLVDQLITNAAGYLLKAPAAPFGWNGPYLSSVLGPDPWNNRYMVNIGLIDIGQGVQDRTGMIKRAVWVLSAGPNGAIETPLSQPVTSAALVGDDIGTRIQ